MNVRAVLKCRECRVAVDHEESGGTITLIRCPECGTEVVGKKAEEVYESQINFFAAKKVDKAISSDFSPPKSDFISVEVKPGPALDDPGGDFCFEALG